MRILNSHGDCRNEGSGWILEGSFCWISGSQHPTRPVMFQHGGKEGNAVIMSSSGRSGAAAGRLSAPLHNNEPDFRYNCTCV